MSLIQCAECGKEISTEAKECPHCGAPNTYVSKEKQYGSYIFVFLGLMFVAILVVLYTTGRLDPYMGVVKSMSGDVSPQTPKDSRQPISLQEVIFMWVRLIMQRART
jgi:hypothetical protein